MRKDNKIPYKCENTNDKIYEEIQKDMKKVNGKSNYAYVITLFSIKKKAEMADLKKYVAGALNLAYVLKDILKTKADLVALVTPDVSNECRILLKKFYKIKICKRLKVDNKNVLENFALHNKGWHYVFTKIHAFNLLKYKKVVLLDIDISPIKYYDHLFTLSTPAGIIELPWGNDESGKKYKKMKKKNSKQHIWMEKYCKCCYNNKKIPKYITKNVVSRNVPGINAGILVIKPNKKIYKDLMKQIDILKNIKKPLKHKYRLPEQQFLTQYFDQWYGADPRFGSHNGYPTMDKIFGIHHIFIYKPWNMKKNDKTMYPSEKYWWKNYNKFLIKYKIKNTDLLKLGI